MTVAPTIDTVRELGQRYSNWGRWGEDDELGTLNYVSPALVRQAASLVRTGRIVEMGLPIDDAGPNRVAAGLAGSIRFT
jgi:hypothetical protein